MTGDSGATPAGVVAAATRASRPRRSAPRRRRSDLWIMAGTIAGSLLLTAMMSALFNGGTVRTDFMITGGVCALVCERMVARVTGQYRRALADANADLEARVVERTADLAAANQALRDAAAEQAALRDEISARDRLATAGMLAAGVSHEIRTPLAAISLGVDELELALPADATDDQRAIVADLRAAADQIAVVVRDLSSLARPASEPLAPVALAPIVASAVRLAGYQLRGGVTVVDGDITGVPVNGNASRLVQVVLNLVLNAARATRPGAANTIRISAEARAADVALRVSDTGTGMAPETLARAFTPFFTTGADRGGTGLGLSICKDLIERMNGSITLASEPGRGTTVELVLPRADPVVPAG